MASNEPEACVGDFWMERVLLAGAGTRESTSHERWIWRGGEMPCDAIRCDAIDNRVSIPWFAWWVVLAVWRCGDELVVMRMRWPMGDEDHERVWPTPGWEENKLLFHARHLGATCTGIVIRVSVSQTPSPPSFSWMMNFVQTEEAHLKRKRSGHQMRIMRCHIVCSHSRPQHLAPLSERLRHLSDRICSPRFFLFPNPAYHLRRSRIYDCDRQALPSGCFHCPRNLTRELSTASNFLFSAATE